jgi:hypothetical protein
MLDKNRVETTVDLLVEIDPVVSAEAHLAARGDEMKNGHITRAE